MRKEYLTPATQEQSITMCQLMAGSGPTIMDINNIPLIGGGEEGIIFGG